MRIIDRQDVIVRYVRNRRFVRRWRGNKGPSGEGFGYKKRGYYVTIDSPEFNRDTGEVYFLTARHFTSWKEARTWLIEQGLPPGVVDEVRPLSSIRKSPDLPK